MEVAFCPNCLRECDIEPVEKSEVLMVRGEPIEVARAIHYRCTVCGSDVFDAESEERTLQSAYDEYRRRHGLLAPEQIAEIRERYGLSQRALAKALGWGVVTIHRYESGALQDALHDTILRQIASDPWCSLRGLTKARIAFQKKNGDDCTHKSLR